MVDVLLLECYEDLSPWEDQEALEHLVKVKVHSEDSSSQIDEDCWYCCSSMIAFPLSEITSLFAA